MKKYTLKYAYWGWREFFAALIPLDVALSDLRSQLIDLSNSNDVILLNSGRTAIQMALRVFKEKKSTKTEVLIPAYTCSAVVEAVQDEGLKPVFVDIAENLNISEDCLVGHNFENTLAIIAIHSCGFPLDMKPICALAERENLFVIDDAAQVQGVSENDVVLGSRGDVGIYSFAQSKTLVGGLSGAGGALLVNDPQLKSDCQKQIENLEISKNGFFDAVSFIFLNLMEQYTFSMAYYWGRVFGAKKYGVFPLTKMNKVNASILSVQMTRLETIIDGKRQAISRYAKIKEKYPAVNFAQNIDKHYVIKLMFELPDEVSQQTVENLMSDMSIQTRRPYNLPWAEHNSSCTKAFKKSKQMIELPIIIGMTDDDVDYILGAFNKAVTSV